MPPFQEVDSRIYLGGLIKGMGCSEGKRKKKEKKNNKNKNTTNSCLSPQSFSSPNSQTFFSLAHRLFAKDIHENHLKGFFLRGDTLRIVF